MDSRISIKKGLYFFTNPVIINKDHVTLYGDEIITFEEFERRVEALPEVNDMLQLAAEVYEGLSDEEIQEIENIALDRRDFFGDRRS